MCRSKSSWTLTRLKWAFDLQSPKSVHVSQYGYFLLISFSSSAEFFSPTDGSDFLENDSSWHGGSLTADDGKFI